MSTGYSPDGPFLVLKWQGQLRPFRQRLFSEDHTLRTYTDSVRQATLLFSPINRYVPSYRGLNKASQPPHAHHHAKVDQSRLLRSPSACSPADLSTAADLQDCIPLRNCTDQSRSNQYACYRLLTPLTGTEVRAYYATYLNETILARPVYGCPSALSLPLPPATLPPVEARILCRPVTRSRSSKKKFFPDLHIRTHVPSVAVFGRLISSP